MKSYYNEDYFKWQSEIGKFGGKANLFKFVDYIRIKDKVVDFGSGGGYLLNELTCAEKIGIEINPEARKSASKLEIKSVNSAEKLPSEWADVIISNHALEHCERPLDELKKLKRILRPGGKLVFVIPHERDTKYFSKNVSQHIYTWSEISAGNIFTAAGFRVRSVETLYHTWPPLYFRISQLFGMKFFNLVSWIYAHFDQRIRQIRVVAIK